MSSQINDSEKPEAVQGVNWHEEEWQELLKRLPEDWQEQAFKLGAWQRVRKLASVADLLRALLVYAVCGYSFRQLGLWATVMGVGCLSERAWRKRLLRAQDWIAWLLSALIGQHLSPGWLPRVAGRVLLIDASRLKIPAGSGDDVRLHCASDAACRVPDPGRGDRSAQRGRTASFSFASRGCGSDRCGLSARFLCATGAAPRSLWASSPELPSGTPGTRRRSED